MMVSAQRLLYGCCMIGLTEDPGTISNKNVEVVDNAKRQGSGKGSGPGTVRARRALCPYCSISVNSDVARPGTYNLSEMH